LKAVGLPELIAHTLEEYERKALELGRNPERLRQLRAKLAQQRLGSPLFDTTTYCRNLESAFRSMYTQKVGSGLDDAESLHQLGIQAMRNGQVDVGIEFMQRSVQVNPAQPTVLLHLARALTQAGRHDAAVAAYDRALAAKPYFAEAHYELGNAFMAFQEPQRALESYERLLALDPAHALGWSNQGNALQGLGRLDQAVESYDRALALRADVALTHYNRANALRVLEQFAAALESYDRALELNPRLAEAHSNRGITLRALTKDDEEALAAFGRAIALKPQFVQALIERGNVLRDTQRPGAALESYGRALAVEPECVEALCNRGSVLVDLKRYAEALESYDRAVALKPDSADILGGRATALEEMSLHEDAATSLERLLQVSPQHDYALGRLLQARLNGCAWDQYSELLTRATTELSAGRRVVHPFLALVAMPSATLQMRAAQLLHSPDDKPAAQPPARKTGRSRSKLRLAYVSADFREHAASYLLAGVFERHDRNLFETIAISLLPPHDSAMGRRVYAGFDRFVDVSQRTNADVAALMREMEIDVAVDLMGYTHFGRPEIFARRSAPVQVSYLGHPGTLGAPYIDYILADEFLIPPESAAHYTERVVYLPGCFQANDDRCVIGPRPTRSEAGLPSEGLVFCSFNSSFKLNPAIFAIWMRLLCAVPNSTLWLLADRSATQQNLLREAAARGVGASRLVFAEKLPYAQHLGRLGLADLFLDTFPYNAGATASDALRTGVPVLTCAGEPLASRMAGSLLTAVGLPELITYTLEEYERKALELARQPRLLQALHARLTGNLHGTPLFDTARFCRHLETAYLQMQDRVMRAEGPVSFSVAKRELAP
jgi:predicted O-linked N-acetylglucosamine transferase (SPINDLY family)